MNDIRVRLINDNGSYISIASGRFDNDKLLLLQKYLVELNETKDAWGLPLLGPGKTYNNGSVITSKNIDLLRNVIERAINTDNLQLNLTIPSLLTLPNDTKISYDGWKLCILKNGNIFYKKTFNVLNDTNTNTVNNINTNDIYNVLSYNLSWEAMSGRKSSTVKYECENKECLNNVIDFLESQTRITKYDIIGLQEASKWWEIYKSDKLKRFSCVSSRISNEDMVTFYNKDRLTLDNTDSVVVTYGKDFGRPIMMLFFNNNLCVINIHAGHDKDIFKLSKHIENTLNKEKYNVKNNKTLKFSYKINNGNDINPTLNYKNILTKLKSYNIILLGDLNADVNEYARKNMSFVIGHPINRSLFTDNKTEYVKTCCDSMLGAKPKSRTRYYDHILATTTNITIVPPNKLTEVLVHASDHLPIAAIIQFQGKHNQQLPVTQTIPQKSIPKKSISTPSEAKNTYMKNKQDYFNLFNLGGGSYDFDDFNEFVDYDFKDYDFNDYIINDDNENLL